MKLNVVYVINLGRWFEFRVGALGSRLKKVVSKSTRSGTHIKVVYNPNGGLYQEIPYTRKYTIKQETFVGGRVIGITHSTRFRSWLKKQGYPIPKKGQVIAFYGPITKFLQSSKFLESFEG